MNIVLPLWVVVSQWTLLFGLGVLIIVMYRQLGFLLHLKDAGTGRDGLPIGEKAPAFDYIPVNDTSGLTAHFESTGLWSLLVFADPGCSSCQGTLPALEQLATTLKQPMRMLVVTSAEFHLIAVVDAFRTAAVAVAHVSKHVPDGLYRTHATPFAYLIDPDGLIQGKGVATDEPAIRKILQKVDRSTHGVASTAS